MPIGVRKRVVEGGSRVTRKGNGMKNSCLTCNEHLNLIGETNVPRTLRYRIFGSLVEHLILITNPMLSEKHC